MRGVRHTPPHRVTFYATQDQINALLPIGFHAQRLTAFVDGTTTAADASGGAYRHALCVGLDSVLSGFRASIVEVERDIMQDEALPLGYIRYKLREYELLFPALHDVIKDIQARSLHGGQILDCLDKHSQTGVPVIKACLRRCVACGARVGRAPAAGD